MYKKIRSTLAIISIMLFLVLCLGSKDITFGQFQSVITHLYPIELKQGDVISDGSKGTSFEIQSDTLFIWVDLMPNAFFAHPTKYIFIRDNKEQPVLVHDGKWYPLLNGHPILFGSSNQSSLVSPYKLDTIDVYFYPLELKKGNTITDGPFGLLHLVESDTLFIWIDLLPMAFFAHPTKYVFICGNINDPISVVDGEWYPLLNGHGILRFNKNLGTLISPFKLSRLNNFLNPIPFQTPISYSK